MLKKYLGRVVSATTPNTNSGIWSREEHYQNLIPAGVIPQNYWYTIATPPSTSQSMWFSGVVQDSNYNIYATGYYYDSSTTPNYKGALVKYDSDGTLQWQKYFGESNGSNYFVFESVAIDSQGNLYCCGYSYITSLSYMSLVKFNSSGTIQWQKYISTSYNSYGMAVYVDGSDNIFITGYATPSNYVSPIYKFDSSGNLLSQCYLSGPSGNSVLNLFGLQTDSSGNVYVSGYYYNGSSYDYYVTKLNSSFVHQWTRSLAGSANNTDVGYDLAIDSSGNIYVAGYVYGGSYYEIVTLKLDSSGNSLWQRKFTSATGSGSVSVGCSLDSSNNLYVTGYSYPGTGYGATLIKYDSSGTLQWQRQFKSSLASPADAAYKPHIKGNSLVTIGYTSLSSPATYGSFVLKVPTDGTKTGTYGSYGYTSTSYTESASTHTVSNLTFSVTNGGYSVVTSSIGSGTLPLTMSKTSIV